MRSTLARGVDQSNHCWSSYLVKHVCGSFATIHQSFDVGNQSFNLFLSVYILRLAKPDGLVLTSERA
jgi:hypothetical protein